LSHGQKPDILEGKERFLKAFKNFKIDYDNEVWIAAPQGGFRQIPALKYRKKILEQAFIRVVYPSGDKLYQVAM
jgi:hypothetical protein